MTKRLWKLPEPWTHSTRPPLLGKLQSSFPQLPQASSLSFIRGHFYRVKNGDISNEL